MPKGDASGNELPQQRPADVAGETFEDFYRTKYDVLKTHAMKIGATKTEAEDAASEAMAQVLKHWATLTSPLTWARQATWTSFVKARQRDRKRLEFTAQAVHKGHLKVDGDDDPSLNVWEDREWVDQMLKLLPPAQKEVMEHAMILLAPGEIAEVLGKTPEAIRGNLFKARQTLLAELENQGLHKPSVKEHREREEIR